MNYKLSKLQQIICQKRLHLCNTLCLCQMKKKFLSLACLESSIFRAKTMIISRLKSMIVFNFILHPLSTIVLVVPKNRFIERGRQLSVSDGYALVLMLMLKGMESVFQEPRIEVAMRNVFLYFDVLFHRIERKIVVVIGIWSVLIEWKKFVLDHHWLLPIGVIGVSVVSLQRIPRRFFATVLHNMTETNFNSTPIIFLFFFNSI